MALPPKGDPRRPGHLASHSLITLAVLVLVFGAIAVIAAMGSRNAAGLIVAAVLGGIGSLILGTAIGVKRHRVWAIICGLVFTAGCLCLGVVGLAVLGWSVISGFWSVQGDGVAGVIGVILLLILLAFTQLLLHLIHALRVAQSQIDVPGFTPILPAARSPSATQRPSEEGQRAVNGVYVASDPRHVSVAPPAQPIKRERGK